MSYQTTPGTIPHLAIEHLRKLPPGTKLVTAALADALGQPANTMCAYLAAVRQHGLLLATTEPGSRFLYWSLGNGRADEPVDPDALIGDLVAPALAPEGFDSHRARITPKTSIPKAKPEVAPDRKPPDRAKPLDAALENLIYKAGAYDPIQPTPAPVCAPPDTVVPLVDKPLPRVRAGTSPARWGVFSDGELHIEKGDAKIELERVEFESLLAFLNRTCREGDA